ncbi:MAG: hypothetical protein ACRDV2_00250, partial [Actinomycetes bacterium]
MTGKSADSVLIVHPSRLLCDGLADSLRDSGIEDVRHAQVLPDAMGELARRPATVTIGAVEAAPSCVSTLVTSLLDAGSTSVVVLAPTVQ